MIMSEISMAERLKTALNEGVVAFSYEKKDGSWRSACGTRNPEIIGYIDGTLPSGTGKHKEGTIAYWDIDAAGWRACLEANIIDITKTMSPADYKAFLLEQGYEVTE